jgi:DtxR family Mn-dependent transcriptional regulator
MGVNLSPNMEMYLKTILRLGKNDQPVRVKAIAEALGVKMPSVSGALRQLKAKGLVLHPAYGAVRLSARGKRAAGSVNQRYEVLRRFFIDVLNLDNRHADRDACEIEHVVSPETMRRLAAFLDYMTRCRLDVEQVIDHFHEYLGWRQAGELCQDCELGGERSANCPMPANAPN